jgi:hypothetical protein
MVVSKSDYLSDDNIFYYGIALFVLMFERGCQSLSSQIFREARTFYVEDGGEWNGKFLRS